MRRLVWSDSSTAAAPPRIRVERFCGKPRERVHLIGEMRPLKTHYRFGENTMPCFAPDVCPFCTDPAWKARYEFFGPALVMDRKAQLWVPIVAVLTQGGGNKLRAAPAGPHRGRLLEIWRVQQGSSSVLHLKELSRIEPMLPPFDVMPHLHRLWFPADADQPAAEMPAPVPFTNEDPPRAQLPIEPERIDPATLAKWREQIGRQHGRTSSAAAVEPPIAAEPVGQPAPTAPVSSPASIVSALSDHLGETHPAPMSEAERDEREALNNRTANIVCREQMARSTFLGQRKGGAA